ncbi:MAG: AMP-binding protein [Pseudomonadota bacterium]|nr:AMP-binding protein [Pseudomonadota bacterium]
MNIASFLSKSSMTWANRPAIAYGSKIILNYKEFGEKVSILAGAMKNSLGLKHGDRIGIAMKNSVSYSIVLFAAWHAGLIVVPMNAKLHSREFKFILENASIRICFVSSDLEQKILDAGETHSQFSIYCTDTSEYNKLFKSKPIPMFNAQPNDVAWLFFTSGTTGRPKGAMLTHRNLSTMTISYFGDVDPVDEKDSLLHAAPMSHGSGLYVLPYVAKGALQIIPRSGGFEPDEIADLLRKYKNVNAFFAPTMVNRLISNKKIVINGAENLKTIIYGGGPMYVEDCQKALKILGPKLVQIYGQGESPMTITALSRAVHSKFDDPRYLDKLGSVGTARSDLEICIVDENDKSLGIDEIGEVCVRGDVVMIGYWQNEEATNETMRNGWLHTGDMGKIDEEGFLTLMDRSKDVIISGGSNIYPREVEEIILQHPDVLEVSVVGRAHADWGEEVIAFVVGKKNKMIKKEELDNLCINNIARFKRPKEYFFIEQLPKNNYGKVLKTRLREMT